MKSTCSLEQISKTGKLDANLTSCQNNLVVMSKMMEIESNTPTLPQNQTAQHLG